VCSGVRALVRSLRLQVKHPTLESRNTMSETRNERPVFPFADAPHGHGGERARGDARLPVERGGWVGVAGACRVPPSVATANLGTFLDTFEAR
jgi:hypothetical protein